MGPVIVECASGAETPSGPVMKGTKSIALFWLPTLLPTKEVDFEGGETGEGTVCRVSLQSAHKEDLMSACAFFTASSVDI